MSPGFTNEFIDVRTTDGLNDTLLTPLLYSAQDGELYRVPIGSTTDGLSVPKIVQNIIPAVGSAWWSGVLHDACYRATVQIWENETQDWMPANVTQQKADGLILEAMETQGIGLVKRQTIYRALRMFGGFAWRANRARK